MSLELAYAYEEPEEIRSLFQEYTELLLANEPAFRQYLDLQHYDQETAPPERKYGLPEGRLYLARWDGAAAGCIGLRRLDSMRCEMKRLYVRPAFRGLKTGRALAEKLIADAREIGYSHMLLDTFPFLRSAVKMYHDLGFHEIPSYNNSPMDGLVYLQLDL